MAQQFPAALGPITALAMLLAVAGNLVLALAIWKSRILPRWTAATFAAGTVTFYLLGAALGMSTTGASLPTQPIGGDCLPSVQPESPGRQQGPTFNTSSAGEQLVPAVRPV